MKSLNVDVALNALHTTLNAVLLYTTSLLIDDTHLSR